MGEAHLICLTWCIQPSRLPDTPSPILMPYSSQGPAPRPVALRENVSFLKHSRPACVLGGGGGVGWGACFSVWILLRKILVGENTWPGI